MKEKIENKLKSEKIVKIMLIVSVILLPVSMILVSSVFKIEPEYGMIVLFPETVFFIVMLSVYFSAFYPLKKSIANLKRIGAMDVIDDVYPEEPTLPKSKIYCGNRAMIVKKPYCILAYHDIAWIYMKVTKAYGIVTVDKSICICTRSGKTIETKANSDEIKWLIPNVIIPRNPSVIVGFGAEQMKRYKQVKAQYKNSLK